MSGSVSWLKCVRLPSSGLFCTKPVMPGHQKTHEDSKLLPALRKSGSSYWLWNHSHLQILPQVEVLLLSLEEWGGAEQLRTLLGKQRRAVPRTAEAC